MIACAPASAEAATVLNPRIAQAVNSTRSIRLRTFLSLTFSSVAAAVCNGGIMAFASAI